MSLYHVIFGINKLAGPLLVTLGINPRGISRFRDCFLGTDNDIIIYTRTGGGNREEFKEQNEALRRNEHFLRDEDDSFDSTYALFHYRIPEDIKDIIVKYQAVEGWCIDPSKRWQEALSLLGGKVNENRD